MEPTMAMESDPVHLVSTLRLAGFLDAEEEAHALIRAARGDERRLEVLVQRRLTGEPLAWIVGRVSFLGIDLQIDPGVYVPRGQTEQVARRAIERLSPAGTAVDLCTGSGAVAAALMAARPGARVLATDVDDRAVRCARANGVDAYAGDLFDPLPAGLEDGVDLIVAVVPYVPTHALAFLPHDTLRFEPTLAYDGGPAGIDLLGRVARQSPRFLRGGGALVLEIGGDEAEVIGPELVACGFGDITVGDDEEGDARLIEATLFV